MEQKTSLPEFQHQEHLEWMNQVDFYQDQVKVFQKEVALALHRHNDLFSIIEQVDEYRKILLNKLERLDEIRTQIILHEKNLAANLEIPSISIWDHFEMRRQMNLFEKDFEYLKKRIRSFVSHQLKN